MAAGTTGRPGRGVRRAGLTVLGLVCTGLGGVLGGCTALDDPSPRTLGRSTLTPAVFAGDSPTEVLAAARRAADGAGSAHFRGVDDDGYRFDLKLARGKGGYVTLLKGRQRVQVRGVGKRAFFRGNAEYWRTIDPTVVRLLADRWLLLPADGSGVKELRGLFTLDKVVDDAFGDPSSTRRVHGKVISGRPTLGVAVEDSDGSTCTIYVGTDGPAYPWRVDPGPEEAVQEPLVISGWGKKLVPQAPTDYLDLDDPSSALSI